MKHYFIKYNQSYNEQDSDVFEKYCVKIEDKFLPVKLNWGEVIGMAKIYSDDIGCFIEKIEYDKDKLEIDLTKDLNMEFGFIVEDFEIKNGVRYIKKTKTMELLIRK